MSASPWRISVKTVGGSQSIRTAKAKTKATGKKEGSVSTDVITNVSNDNAASPTSSNSTKDPPVDMKSCYENSSSMKGEEVPPNFTVRIEADDNLSKLHSLIEEVTGLKESQQRLIYRGRLITNQLESNTTSRSNSSVHDESSSKNSKDQNASSASSILIRDIDGLCDGQTIHLVPRPLPPDTNLSASTSESRTTSSDNDSATSGRSRPSNISTNASAASLLATIFGLADQGERSDEDEESNENNDTFPIPRAFRSSNSNTNILSNIQERRRQTMRSLSSNASRISRTGSGVNSSRRSGSSSRNAAFVWEANSLEPVRQGLMTLHTLLDSHLDNNNRHSNRNNSHATISLSGDNQTKQSDSPDEVDIQKTSSNSTADQIADNTSTVQAFDSGNNANSRSRRWFRGQWLDVKDTVDQWLEATIIEVVSYKDVFTAEQLKEYERNTTTFISKTQAQKINEEVSQKSDGKVDPIVGANDMEGRKMLFLTECDTETLDADGNVSLRFRDNIESTQLILVHYNGWPHRWDEWIRGDSERIGSFRTKTRHYSSAPFASPTPNSLYSAAPSTYIYEDDENDRAALLPEIQRGINLVQQLLTEALPSPITQRNNNVSRSETPALNTDLPWNPLPNYMNTANSTGRDDMNRTDNSNIGPRQIDIDADDSKTSESASSSIHALTSRLNRDQIGNLAPLLDRLGRILTDAAPHIASYASTLPAPDDGNSIELESISHTSEIDPNVSTLVENGDEPITPAATSVDYNQYLVNTSRDENPRRRTRQSSSNNENNASFLGTYLAARNMTEEDRDPNIPTWARILRMGSGTDNNGGGNGGNGGGIDIHIHAIVTPVAGATAGVDVGLGLGDAGAFPFVGLQSISQDDNVEGQNIGSDGRTDEVNVPTSEPWSIPEEEDEMALFSDLYTESPTPFEHGGDEQLGNEEQNHRETAENQEEQEQSRNNRNGVYPVALSMVVGDIPLPIPVNEENDMIGDLNSNVHDNVENNLVGEYFEHDQPAQSQTQPYTNISQDTRTDPSMSSDTSNTTSRRRGAFMGRFVRGLRRRSNSRRD